MFLPRNPWRREPTESLNEPEEEDLERLAELREQGSRLNLPHPVRGFLRFDSEQAARQVAELLGKEGFSCRIRASQDGSWVTVAIRQLVPTPGGIGVAETALSGLLGAVAHVSTPYALSAVLLFRLITFYLPAALGWLALNYLQRHDVL